MIGIVIIGIVILLFTFLLGVQIGIKTEQNIQTHRKVIEKDMHDRFMSGICRNKK